MPLGITAIQGIPEIAPGDDLAALIAQSVGDQQPTIGDTDVLVVAHKVVSKAEGQIRALADVTRDHGPQSLQRAWARIHATSRSSSTSRARCCAHRTAC